MASNPGLHSLLRLVSLNSLGICGIEICDIHVYGNSKEPEQSSNPPNLIGVLTIYSIHFTVRSDR